MPLFARLDMSIGYTFNTKKIDWLDKARIYVAAQNLFVITSYSGLDPEVELFRGEASDTDAGLSPGTNRVTICRRLVHLHLVLTYHSNFKMHSL